MKRRPIRAILLALLAVAAGLVLWRSASGPPVPEGFVVIDGVGADRLERRAFRLDTPARVVADAQGSFGEGGALEAYAWLLDARTREVVWTMDTARARRIPPTRAAQTDTLDLPAGTYELYFTPFGQAPKTTNRFTRLTGTEGWRNDRGTWYVALRALTGAAGVLALDAALPEPADLVWSTAPQRPGETAERILEVTAATTLTARAAGTADTRAFVERLPSGERVWTLDLAAAPLAGGAPRNRIAEATIRLAPGLYRAVSTAPRGPGPRDWRVNPPRDPLAWGLTLTGEGARAFDPFRDGAPAVSILRVEGDARRFARFEVARTTPVFVSGLGELSSRSRFDYATLAREPSGEEVWAMEYEDSSPGGGASKNRRVDAFLTLAPGTYTLRYRSDDSHHYGAPNDAEPEHPERWGVALFALADSAAIRVTAEGDEREASADDDAPPPAPDAVADVPAPPSEDGALAAITQAGDSEDLARPFRLDAATDVRIYATGEVVGETAFDTAWITDASGTTVWRLTDAGTRPAGGPERNRLFDGTLRLPAGRYTLRYKTDDSHAYGTFGDGDAPVHPDFWGAVVTRASEDERE